MDEAKQFVKEIFEKHAKDISERFAEELPSQIEIFLEVWECAQKDLLQQLINKYEELENKDFFINYVKKELWKLSK